MDRIVANIIEDKIIDKPVQKKEAIEPSNSMSENPQQKPEKKQILEQLGDDIVDLRSALFTVAEQELKSMAKISTVKYAIREK
jgi:hypothetical protein